VPDRSAAHVKRDVALQVEEQRAKEFIRISFVRDTTQENVIDIEESLIAITLRIQTPTVVN